MISPLELTGLVSKTLPPLNRLKKYLFFILAVIPVYAHAQNDYLDGKNLVQFSGLVLTSDSLMGISDVSIRIKNTPYGTLTNQYGIFTIAAKPADTLVFTAIGYKPNRYVVPSAFSGNRYSMIVTLSADTIMIDPIIVKPFISKNLFEHYFVNMQVEDDELTQLAMHNLEAELLKEQAMGMGADGAENQKYVQRDYAQKYYYAGQLPPQNIFNPLAWAQFIKAWKNGDFKNKKKRQE